MEQLDPHSATPMYRQLADLIRSRIDSGEYPPGRPIPSKKTLQQRHGVSQVTVDAALAILREDGLLETHPGKGLYVRPRED